jgi:hypothetical protein
MEIQAPTFDMFLASKLIDAEQFKESMPETYEKWKKLYESEGPVRFDQVMKFMFNPIRRSYPLKG